MIARHLAGIAATLVVACGLAVLPAACATAQGGQADIVTPGRASVDTASLRRALDSLRYGSPRNGGYAVIDLDGGARLSRRIRRVWDKMEALGLPYTKVHLKTFLRSSSVAMDSSVK